MYNVLQIIHKRRFPKEQLMNPNDAVNLSIKAGEIMLSNGAETYRVEEICRITLQSLGYHDCESFVVPTGLFVSITAGGEVVSGFKRITKRVVNVDALIQMNDISRNFAEGRITGDEALVKMEELSASEPPGNVSFIKLFAAAISVGCFTFLFGGSLLDCLNAFFTGFILQVLLFQLRKSRISDVLVHIAGGIMISFIVLTLINLGVGSNYNAIIIGSLMLMVPGITLTTAARDVLKADYLSGAARLLDAVIVATSLAAGVGTALRVWFQIFGGVYI
jgi:uncharacterized membrane protein YjjP (DUF1212 family)